MLGSSTLPELINFQALQSYQNVNVSIPRDKQLRIPSGGDLFLGLEDFSIFWGGWEVGNFGRFGHDLEMTFGWFMCLIPPESSMEKHRKGPSFRDSSHIFIVYLRVWFSKQKCQLQKKNLLQKGSFFFWSAIHSWKVATTKLATQNSNRTNQTSPSQANDQDPKLPFSSHQPTKRPVTAHHIILHL